MATFVTFAFICPICAGLTQERDAHTRWHVNNGDLDPEEE